MGGLGNMKKRTISGGGRCVDVGDVIGWVIY